MKWLLCLLKLLMLNEVLINQFQGENERKEEQIVETCKRDSLIEDSSEFSLR